MNKQRFEPCVVSGCRQHRTSTSLMCGDHVKARRARVEREKEHDRLRSTVYAATNIDDIKPLLFEIIERLERL